MWATCMGRGGDKLQQRKVFPLLWQEQTEERLDYLGPTRDKIRLMDTGSQETL